MSGFTDSQVARAGVALPDYPWDALARYADTAATHPGGLVDLSVGTPVDPTPQAAREALRANSNAPGYPQTAGSTSWREAARGWLQSRFGAPDGLGLLPTIGSKEFVASLPSQLGLGPGDTVALPELAYPTYEIGAMMAGAAPLRLADVTSSDPKTLRLVWLNSPANPHGAMLSVTALREIVSWARSSGTDVVVASDECYCVFDWDTPFVSVLDPRVNDGDLTGLLAVHSLSKSANLAGYRAGLVAGDPELLARLLLYRRHAGLIVPTPVQAAMVAVFADPALMATQRARYAARRRRLLAALPANFRVDASAGGLYLWASAGEDCWSTVARLAEIGILVAPGQFYGVAGREHVRIALTATDERIAAAAERLEAL